MNSGAEPFFKVGLNPAMPGSLAAENHCGTCPHLPRMGSTDDSRLWAPAAAAGSIALTGDGASSPGIDGNGHAQCQRSRASRA